MISCIQFIPAYSEFFKFLEDRDDRDAVVAFWEYLSDHYLRDSLRAEVEKNGIRGCWNYWSRSLNEEAADFTMELDEEAGAFAIRMRRCPSKGMLLSLAQMEPYHDYCGHCDLLYRRVLEPLGYRYEYDMSECDRARCRLTVTREPRHMSGLLNMQEPRS